ncbi:Domain of unknown function DUF2520-containing protein [Desulfotomaculum nigrificans CO-1-SRB]|uniref:NADP oxidoreductase coenzyme F420-dependent n=1 Tax=Desulfotomaculum nigrificans (strain DSM 14880 / VKM B-2319 / CO-1-SRB) TaxID=868595 RepID=F6B537_DESCC|nr:DUF2520 domain-containing protein [Desulfotomaculum nigrificans]AEF93056.1 Domain of unknown function DUF2520-containing protein [Desulfotomaculum nigrificans CO-1-SRB]
MKRKPSFAVIGAGKVGSALGLLLKERGYRPVGVASRSMSSAQKLAEQLETRAFHQPAAAARAAELVFITTTDREIGPTASLIARQGGCYSGQIVVHTSGALASNIMEPVRQQGAWAVSVHPLQSFANVAGARENLPGSCFALEGDEQALPAAQELVKDLQGQYFVIKAEDKPLYHAAAVVASNYLVSLIHLSSSIYQELGLSEKQSLDALFPLIQGTLNNIARVGTTAALTGPVARGDGATLLRHMQALKGMDWRTQQAYSRLGLYTVKVAMENGSITANEGAALSNIFMEVDQIEQKGNHCRLPANETGRTADSHVNRLRLSHGHIGRCFRYRRHPGGGLPR